MKIFAIYGRVILDNKPDWFDDFRQKYDQDTDLHITLKQPCYIEDDLAEEVKRKFTKLFNEFDNLKNRIEVIFEKIKIEKEVTGDYCVMINVIKNSELLKMQMEVVKVFAENDDFLEPELWEYEKNFQPHVTIGRDVKHNQLDKVIRVIGEKCWCKGYVDEIVLSIVDKKNNEEVKKRADITMIRLLGIGE